MSEQKVKTMGHSWLLEGSGVRMILVRLMQLRWAVRHFRQSRIPPFADPNQ